jgi:hypothetical protein
MSTFSNRPRISDFYDVFHPLVFIVYGINSVTGSTVGLEAPMRWSAAGRCHRNVTGIQFSAPAIGD